MTLHGTIRNGMVVFDGGPNLPDGTPVAVVLEHPQPVEPTKGDRMSEEEYRRVRAILDEITALPNENPGDTFSGADHDKVLYGEP